MLQVSWSRLYPMMSSIVHFVLFEPSAQLELPTFQSFFFCLLVSSSFFYPCCHLTSPSVFHSSTSLSALSLPFNSPLSSTSSSRSFSSLSLCYVIHAISIWSISVCYLSQSLSNLSLLFDSLTFCHLVSLSLSFGLSLSATWTSFCAICQSLSAIYSVCLCHLV